MKSQSRNSVKHVYKSRSQFILLGLTGRTGSGCTSSLKLLSSPFKKIEAPKPKLINDNEERKYNIVYSYCEENWKPYIAIQIKDIITSFIIENSYNDFIKFLHSENKNNQTQFQKLKNDLDKKVRSDYEKIYELRKILIKDREKVEKKSNQSASEKADIRQRLYDFYFKLLPPFSKKLKKSLNKFSGNLYTTVYQTIGNNLRSSGEALSSKYNGKNIYRIAIRVNKVIKIVRRIRGKKKKTYIAIDAFRNPFEITFFRERYAAFYLVAVSTEYQHRISRLKKSSDITNKQLKEIDKEYENKLEGNEVFYSQDIGSCIQLADIHINNPEVSIDDYNTLKRQLIYYTSLILHPGIVTPSHLERCMQMAYNAKLNSGCLSRQVGAVITDKHSSIKAVGWNSVPEGHVPCLLRSTDDLLNNEDQIAYSEYESNDADFRKKVRKIYRGKKVKKSQKKCLKGLHVPYCFKDIKNKIDGEKNQVHTRALHAEENAFLQITKYGGTAIKEGMLFVTASPCELCSKKAYQLGIKSIVYIDPYPGIAKDHILKSGNQRPKLKLFNGAIGRAYNQLYEPLLSYKDELEMILDI